jgi:hypothetical protein
MRAVRVVGPIAVVLALAGCGERSASPEPRSSSEAEPEHRDAAVIRRWSETLRAGDVEAATRLFSVPATVANGGAPQLLRTRTAIRVFNESLPCGARLLRTRHKDGYTVATFRLTERRGGDCGSGVGAVASTAFVVHRGRIREWLRLPDPGRGGQAPDTSTS